MDIAFFKMYVKGLPVSSVLAVARCGHPGDLDITNQHSSQIGVNYARLEYYDETEDSSSNSKQRYLRIEMLPLCTITRNLPLDSRNNSAKEDVSENLDSVHPPA